MIVPPFWAVETRGTLANWQRHRSHGAQHLFGRVEGAWSPGGGGGGGLFRRIGPLPVVLWPLIDQAFRPRALGGFPYFIFFLCRIFF